MLRRRRRLDQHGADVEQLKPEALDVGRRFRPGRRRDDRDVASFRRGAGEPLAQQRCLVLLQKLCDAGFDVSLETSGALDVSAVDLRVSRVVALKTPGSAEMARNRLENLPLLTRRDQVKFVICSREDYQWAKDMVVEHQLAERTMVLFSPSKGQITARELADWIVADRLPVRFQMQLHKLLWNDEPGR